LITLNLSVTVKSQDITIKQAELQYRNDLDILNLLCGITDTSTVSLAAPDISIQNVFDINTAPAMMQFKIDSLKNMNSKFIIDLQYKPKLDALLMRVLCPSVRKHST